MSNSWWYTMIWRSPICDWERQYLLTYHGWSILSDDWRGMRKAGAD